VEPCGHRDGGGPNGPSRPGAAWRTVLLMLFAMLVSVAFAFLLLLIGALG